MLCIIGEGQLYTVGLIDRHRVVSTKLSKIGRGSEARLSPGDTIPRLLGIVTIIQFLNLILSLIFYAVNGVKYLLRTPKLG